VPEEILRQSSFTNGELDPRLHGRRDVKVYFASAASLENLMTAPTGELTRRPGQSFIDKARRQLVTIDLAGAVLTAPVGGATTGLAAGTGAFTTTTPLGTADPQVLLSFELSGSPSVALVDLVDYGAQDGAAPAEAPFAYPWADAGAGGGPVPASVFDAIKVQYKIGTEWHDFGGPVALGSILRTRRLGVGPRRAVQARYWRLLKVGATDWGAAVFTLRQLRLWSEGAALSPVRIWPFSFDDKTQRYFLVATDRNLEVYHQDGRAASVPIPHGAEILTVLRRAQVLDTLLEFHNTVAPNRVMRQGRHTEWDSRPVTFASLPKFDYNGDRAGGVDEVQQLRFDSYAGGDTFNITLEGEVTSSIAYTSTAGDMVTALTGALEALPNVGPGGVTVANTATDVYSVTFTGANRSDDVGEMAPKTLASAAGGVFAATLTNGRPGGEPVISAARGWPACGTFYQSRLWMGGLRSRPQTLLGSRLGDYFEFESAGTLKAIDVTLDTDETTTVQAMFPGQHLQVFTSSAEFFFPVEPIVAPPPVKRATKRGLSEGTPLAEMDGATVFVTAGGGALAGFLYSQDNRQTYDADFLSKWSTHLLAGSDAAPLSIVDFGFRRARTPVEADRAVLIRSDGQAAVMHALVNDAVIGFTRWTTDGLYRASAADLAGDQYVAVQRDTRTGPEVFIEKIDPAAMLDAQVKATGPATEIGGLDHLEGRTVALYIDDGDAGDAVVTGGRVVLPYPALRETSAGLLFVPKGLTLPGALQQDQRSGADMQVRVGGIAFRLGPTANLKAGLKDGRLWPLALKRRPNVIDGQGPGDDAFEGWSRAWPVPGFRADAQCQFEQARPGPLSIKEIVLTVTS
jgi:hypothetical protein